MTSRREFIKTILITGATALTRPVIASAYDDEWSRVPEILKRIKPPVFPRRDFDIRRFGAKADGRADSTAAFRSAIEACSKAGGGRVVVPRGTFLTGAIHLKSNVNLHIATDATIKFSRDKTKYLPVVFTRWEGVELMNYSPFIYAFEQENIAITGDGTIDGQGDCQNWWPWKGRGECGWKEGNPSQIPGRRALFDMAEKGVPVRERIFGEGHYLRPQFIQPYRCNNILIEGVTLRNSPMWEIHPVLCKNVTVQRVKIISSGPNNDGCNPESCTDVLIRDCYFDTGDDCIAIKSGRNADGRRLNAPSENIVIQGCRMKDGHGGVTIGSEISGGVRWVFAEKCHMNSPNLDRALRFKNNAMRGGIIEHVYARDIEVGEVSDAVISIDFNYEEGEKGSFIPVVRNVGVRNLRSTKSKYPFYLRGFKRAPITNILIEDCSIENAAQASVLENVERVTMRNVRVNGQLQ